MFQSWHARFNYETRNQLSTEVRKKTIALPSDKSREKNSREDTLCVIN